MEKVFDNVISSAGRPVARASVAVTLHPSGERATIYSDDGITTRPNPIIADDLGYFEFYAAAGRYTLTITGDGIEPIVRTDLPIGEPGSGADVLDALGKPDGAAKVGFSAGSGAQTRSTQDKLRETVSIKDFGAVGDGATDNLAAFNAAIAAMPATGGKISIGAGTWYLSAKPTWDTKSIYWDIDPAALFNGPGATGSGAFLKMQTNGDCTVAGPYMLSRRAHPTIDGAASFAWGIESVQPASDTNSGYGALFLGAQLNAVGPYSITSALNAVATANPGSSGNVFGIEIDVATFAAPGTGTQFGLLISGFGGNDCTFGIRVNRHDGGSSKYLYGLAIAHARIGMFVDDKNAALENGLLLGDPPARYSNKMLQALQISDGGDVLLLQRRTNVSPTGNFFSCINADNTQQMSALDVSGNFFAQRVQATYFRAVGAPVAQSAGQMGIGAQTSATATAGAIAPPAQVAGYLVMYIGTTQYKVPYYAA